MTIPKNKLETLFLLAKGTEGELSLQESRIRDAFYKPLLELTQTFEQDRRTIYEKFCQKDEEGNADVSDGNYKFDQKILPKVNKELEILYAEEVELPSIDKAILEKSSYKPKVGEAEIIDEIFTLL